MKCLKKTIYKGYKSKATPKISCLYQIWVDNDYLKELEEDKRYKERRRGHGTIYPFLKYVENKNKTKIPDVIKNYLMLFFENPEIRRLCVKNVDKYKVDIFTGIEKTIEETLIKSYILYNDSLKISESKKEFYLGNLPIMDFLLKTDIDAIVGKEYKGIIDSFKFFQSLQYMLIKNIAINNKEDTELNLALSKFDKIWKKTVETLDLSYGEVTGVESVNSSGLKRMKKYKPYAFFTMFGSKQYKVNYPKKIPNYAPIENYIFIFMTLGVYTSLKTNMFTKPLIEYFGNDSLKLLIKEVAEDHYNFFNN